MEADIERRPCRIEQVGLARNRQPRWWCVTHKAPAGGANGTRLECCEAAYTFDRDLSQCFHLDPDDFPGGIGVWAALEPVLNTTGYRVEAGIHVHARKRPGKPKEIDRTFPAVAVRCRQDLFGARSLLIRRDAAISFYFGRLLGKSLKNILCPHCGEPHLDAAEFALSPHRQHLCHGCGRYFREKDDAISNPITYVRDILGNTEAGRKIKKVDRSLVIDLNDYPGGAQVWASDPAIFWTASKPEEEGIHVHLFSKGSPEAVLDDTYGEVVLNGTRLDQNMIRYLMGQKALPLLRGRIAALKCPNCDGDHFDQGKLAFEPHEEHKCEHCAAVFRPPGRSRLLVSNPVSSQIDGLQQRNPYIKSRGGE